MANITRILILFQLPVFFGFRTPINCFPQKTKWYHPQINEITDFARDPLNLKTSFYRIDRFLVGESERKPVEKVLGKEVTPRNVQVKPGLNFTVYEAIGTGGMVEDWIEDAAEDIDPFGAVVWPAAHLMSQLLLDISDVNGGLSGRKFMELGAGTGLCSLAAASCGAKVVATDNNKAPLELLDYATEQKGLDGLIDTQLYDFCDEEVALPNDIDALIIADCIYNEKAAEGMARQCLAAVNNNIQTLHYLVN